MPIIEVDRRRSIVVNWQVTATTIYCDAVDDDDVRIVVNKDWTTT